MEAQLERLQEMSQTLESSGFSHQQSNAVIKSVALAMQTFAVTPEVLDQRIDKVMDAVKAQDNAIKAQRDDIKDLNKSITRLERTMLRYMMTFTLIMLGATLGLIGTFLTQIL